MIERFRRPLLAALFCLSAAGPALAGKDVDPEQIRRWVDEGAIVPLEPLLQEVLAGGPGRLLGVELEREKDGLVYEVELLGPDGRVWEYEFDARTGELLEQKIER